jgi:hypothetical protein
MSIVQPLLELLHEVRGTVSPFHRDIAMALRKQPVPRPKQVAATVGALLAPWWGFAAYFCVYAILVVTVVALLGAALMAGLFHKAGMLLRMEEMDFFWPSMVLTAPLSMWPFVAWVKSRRGGLTRVAREATVVPAAITAATVVSVHGGLSFRGAAHSTHITVASGQETFRGYVPAGPAWAAPGQPVEVLTLPNHAYAVLLTPDGGTRPLTRV